MKHKSQSPNSQIPEGGSLPSFASSFLETLILKPKLSNRCRRLDAEIARCDVRVKEAERIGAERLEEAVRRHSMESAGLRERVLDAERALRDVGVDKQELERVMKR